MNQKTKSQIIKKINCFLNTNVKITGVPPQGMDSEVFFIIDENKKEYAIKYGIGVDTDIFTYNLIHINNIKIPVPKKIASFIVNGLPLIILEKINYPLLETIATDKMARYIPSMLNNLKEIHKLKFDKTKCLPWKNYLLSKFDSSNPNLNWDKISHRKGLNGKIISDSVKKILITINNTDFTNIVYSYLHTDFNQRNLFVDPNSNKIASIIDWGEATYGDPIYDFARIRMLIWHFNLNSEAIDNYYKLMNYSDQEMKLDNLYWISRVIEYLAYYSEKLNEFNIGRIKKHQDFLVNYNWN